MFLSSPSWWRLNLVEAMEDVLSKCSSMDKSKLLIVPVDLEGGLSGCKFTIIMVSKEVIIERQDGCLMVESAHGHRRRERLLITDPCGSVPHWPHSAGQYGWCRLGKSSFLWPCQERGVSCSLAFAFDPMRMYWSAWLYSWANCLVVWPAEHMSPWKDCFPLIVAVFFLCLVQSSQQLWYFHAHVGRFFPSEMLLGEETDHSDKSQQLIWHLWDWKSCLSIQWPFCIYIYQGLTLTLVWDNWMFWMGKLKRNLLIKSDK